MLPTSFGQADYSQPAGIWTRRNRCYPLLALVLLVVLLSFLRHERTSDAALTLETSSEDTAITDSPIPSLVTSAPLPMANTRAEIRAQLITTLEALKTQMTGEFVSEIEKAIRRLKNCSDPCIKPKANAAVCIYGANRMHVNAAKSFKKHIYEALHYPDVFIRVGKLDPKLPITRDPEYWNAVEEMRAISRSADFEVKDWDYRPIHLNGTYAKCLDARSDNWNFGWATQPPGSSLHQIRGVADCGAAIKQAENERGQQYDRVILARIDYVYVHDHPPLEELDPNLAWIPLANDWGGVNDRFAVHNRVQAEVRFNLHQKLMDGSFDCTETRGFCNSERLLAILLNQNHIQVGRFRNIGFLQCLGQTATSPECSKYSELKDIREYIADSGWKWALDDLVAAINKP